MIIYLAFPKFTSLHPCHLNDISIIISMVSFFPLEKSCNFSWVSCLQLTTFLLFVPKCLIHWACIQGILIIKEHIKILTIAIIVEELPIWFRIYLSEKLLDCCKIFFKKTKQVIKFQNSKFWPTICCNASSTCIDDIPQIDLLTAVNSYAVVCSK